MRNKGVNISNYVDVSGIYDIYDVAYVFCELIINPPGLWILGSIWRSPLSLTAPREVGGR